MLEELSGRYKPCSFPTLLLLYDVVIPEAIVVVIEVNRHLALVFLLLTDALVIRLSVWLPIEICHASLSLSVHLVLLDVQLRIIELLTLFVGVSTINASHHLIDE